MSPLFRMALAVAVTAWVASLGIAIHAAPLLLAAQQSSTPTASGDITGWFCPMHPDVTADGPSRCSKCGMALIAGDPFDTREYALDFTTEPAVVKAQVPFKMIFRIRHPKTGAGVNTFELVHDKQYHLFVVSQDMTFFQHIHPELQA
ncbi:MAG TPA: heavy metal-binding domain-containing protein, partial [Vicinamibacterales bacterium]